MPLPPLQDEVGVGPLGDPQRVGQQHLLWVHPHIPGRRGRTHNGAAGRLLHTPARTGAHSRTRSPARPAPRRKAPSAAGSPRRPGRNKAPAGGRGGRRGRGHSEQHPPRAPPPPPPASPRPQTPRPAARSPAAAQGGGRTRKWCREVSGSGSAVGKAAGYTRGFGPAVWAELAWGAAAPAAPTQTPGRRGLEQPRALEATARYHSARNHSHPRRSPALPAGRTLRTRRMNDGSALHSERAQVAPVASRAGPPWALGAATCLCGWLWRNLLGTVRQTLGPTPIPAERTLPVPVGWCVFMVDAP